MSAQSVMVLPSEYGGVRYRARDEARWAIFFDRLGINHLYEPQGFVTDGTPYLPDFFLVPSRTPRLLVEVKWSFDADPEGVQKLRNLIAARGRERGVILPAITSGETRIAVIGPDGHGETWEDDRGTWLTCPDGYHYDVQPCPERGCGECGHEGDYWYESDGITEAYRYARNYRFGRQ